jgi:hypothetical protein
LAHEHAAIASRYSRVASAWASHLAASHEAILNGANRCSARRCAFVIGAGDCRDVPVDELARTFELTVLADIVVSSAALGFARRHSGRVACWPWDATGALAELASRRETISADEMFSLFENAKPVSLPGEEPDLVISANCLSQLGLIPTASLRAVKKNHALAQQCANAAARSHLRWLAQRRDVRVLIGDIARLDIAPDGRVLKREDLTNDLDLRPPDRAWRWNLAPIPELSRTFHRVHEVGAWIDNSMKS